MKKFVIEKPWNIIFYVLGTVGTYFLQNTDDKHPFTYRTFVGMGVVVCFTLRACLDSSTSLTPKSIETTIPTITTEIGK